MVDEVGVVKGLSPDKSPDQVGAGTGRRRGVMGLRKDLPTAPRLRDALSRGFLGSEKIGEYLG